MNGLDLFSGIGGISVALEPWVRTVAYCEQNRYAQGVLLSRMASNGIDRAPIWDDVTSLRKSMLPEIDIIFGGFPCQDISVAGNGKGLAGERSGLFYEIVRITKEIGPSFVFLENVPAIRTRGLREVVRAFTEIGYDCRWTCLSASSIGAPHRRERWFLLAHANGTGLRLKSGGGSGQDGQEASVFGLDGSHGFVADSMCSRWDKESEPRRLKEKHDSFKSPISWSAEPNVGRVVDGLPFRMDRIKCLGNSVVPAQVREAFMKLSGLQIAQRRMG